jgi:type IV pilus assembly protein PilC
VVPQFESIFKSFGADLPAFTKMVVNASKFMQSKGVYVLGGMVALIVGLVMAKNRSKRFAHFIDRFSLKLPVIGEILKQAAIARFCRTLAITFAAGVPLVDALKIVSGATGNRIYDEAAMRIRGDVSVGHQLQLAMQQTDLFPPMVVQMAAIGEEAGSLDAMLVKVAEAYEEEGNAVDAPAAACWNRPLSCSSASWLAPWLSPCTCPYSRWRLLYDRLSQPARCLICSSPAHPSSSEGCSFWAP